MERGSATDPAGEPGDCPECHYRTRRSDRHYVAEHDVWHIVCYNCGVEWVE